LKKDGSEVPDAGDLLKRYNELLEMPGSLEAVSVGQEKWDLLANESMTDPWIKTNPRKINGPEDLKEIFELAR
jgi:maleylacetate reductase